MSATAAPIFPNPLANAPVMMGAVSLGQTVGEFILENIRHHSASLVTAIAEGNTDFAQRLLFLLAEDFEQAHAVEIPIEMVADAHRVTQD